MAWTVKGRPKQLILGPGDSRAPVGHIKYGLKPDEQAALLRAQGGRCLGCGTSTPGGIGWCVDHDHACPLCGGKGCRRCVRGILCNPCNNSLAQARDKSSTLRSLADYLDRWAAR
jgi:Recombination endonuclease VII